MNIEDSKKFWENCDETFAHITANKWLKSRNELVKSFGLRYGPFNPSGKTLIDYGIGAAYQAVYLFENSNITKYVGIDIADRSLKAAANNLKKYDQNKIQLIKAPVDFSKLNADIFTSFAVIQHFPDEKYLNDFLKNIRDSSINEVILQIRYSKSNEFSGSCKTQDDVMMGCRTNKEYILSIMDNYKCIQYSNVHDKSNYQYLYFVKI